MPRYIDNAVLLCYTKDVLTIFGKERIINPEIDEGCTIYDSYKLYSYEDLYIQTITPGSSYCIWTSTLVASTSYSDQTSPYYFGEQ